MSGGGRIIIKNQPAPARKKPPNFWGCDISCLWTLCNSNTRGKQFQFLGWWGSRWAGKRGGGLDPVGGWAGKVYYFTLSPETPKFLLLRTSLLENMLAQTSKSLWKWRLPRNTPSPRKTRRLNNRPPRVVVVAATRLLTSMSRTVKQLRSSGGPSGRSSSCLTPITAWMKYRKVMRMTMRALRTRLTASNIRVPNIRLVIIRGTDFF